MNEFDYLSLNGKLLRTFIAVYEENSVTRAAELLGVTQSAVSHMLEKLRDITGDPLFVKSGRSVVATAQAGQLAIQAQKVLDGLQAFAHGSTFVPANFEEELIIAAGDMQRDLLLPQLFDQLRNDAPKLRLRVIPSDVPSLELLRNNRCFLAISPRLPDGSDILHRRLFTGSYAVFYDGSVRKPPTTLKSFLAAEHITVSYEHNRSLDIDRHLADQGVHRNIIISVAGFGGIAPFLRGSNRLATVPAYLQTTHLAGLQLIQPPVACPELPMYAIWHQRHRHDPVMRWVLDCLYKTTGQIDGLQPGKFS